MFEYIKMEKEHLEKVSKLGREIFLLELLAGHTNSGLNTFSDFCNATVLETRMNEGGFGHIATFEGNLAGFIFFKTTSHISLFFVDKLFRGQGVGRNLLDASIDYLMRTDAQVSEITVNSDVSATYAYLKLGFSFRSGIQQKDGLAFVEMFREIPERSACLRSVGYISSPFLEREGVPIQPSGGAQLRGQINIFPEYEEGLADLDGFSHIIIIYRFHRQNGYNLKVVPFMDTEPRGIFSTRSPKRVSGIGMSIVKLVSVKGNIVEFSGVDMLDKTPVYDIKPWIHNFDYPGESISGWMKHERKAVEEKRSDNRFTK
ncbi:tRNA (N6-threonylcarbamoyladenosine(37)-N6)-methyltransferase TrmO [Myxococcota bacterium]|nr:tRNA (N6-threonylcarbamoyladenosine(37)-N6)-methyltransferase TrmO [Myxococcota bacterium]MBU1381460.1 tRNA (N6-threonylcarbamoyladenosine(37)-N6)-methyltransferase TrmO [Myxococcota bacterium]MBU1496286.1 tRNA (N6-threonylcarbamoyladenosine(37)-N6)-methyltransferase TrmO [Myxococcota bacterium]